MIKFFRRIRQQLVTEKKISKYLLYAIGEILLVVFGILIALYLNTKKEIKTNNAQVEKILANVFLKNGNLIGYYDVLFCFVISTLFLLNEIPFFKGI